MGLRHLILSVSAIVSLACRGQVSFGPMQVISEAYNQPLAPVLHDMDQDADLDILTISQDSGLVWHRNDGYGNFSGTIVIDPDAEPYWSQRVGPVLLDVDNDGDLDIISPNGEHVTWWADLGNGSFGPPEQLLPDYLTDLHAELIDDDAYVDLVGIRALFGNAYWYQNDGQGGFMAHDLGEGGVERWGVCADVDSDGHVDLVRPDSVYLNWYRNDAGGTFEPLTWLAEVPHGQWSHAVWSIAMADLDADGDKDLITQDEGLPYAGSVLTNDGSGAFTVTQGLGGYPFLGILLHDLDVDGDQDLVFSDPLYVGWRPNDGTGHFLTRDTIATIGPGAIGNSYSSTSMADMNGDGNDDIVVTFQRYMPPPQNMTLAWIPVYPMGTGTGGLEVELPVISPNPLTDRASFTMPVTMGSNVSIRIIDLHGRVVRQWSAREAQSVTMERGSLCDGMYMLLATSEQGRVAHAHFVVR